MRLSLLAVLAMLAPGLAQAQAKHPVEPGLQQHLEREVGRDGCSLMGFEKVHDGPLGADARRAIVARYTLEGCGGGNNWSATFGVFLVEGGRLREVPLPADPRSQRALPQVVEGVRVQGARILVEGMNYGAEDARCCPSVPRRTALALQEGRLVIAR